MLNNLYRCTTANMYITNQQKKKNNCLIYKKKYLGSLGNIELHEDVVKNDVILLFQWRNRGRIN